MLKTAFFNEKSFNHLLLFAEEGLYVFKPISSLKMNNPESYLNPNPLPIANSSRSFRPSKLLKDSLVSSKIFQMFPISENKAPLKFPNILNLYSRFKASLKLASLNSFLAPLEPGPSL